MWREDNQTSDFGNPNFDAKFHTPTRFGFSEGELLLLVGRIGDTTCWGNLDCSDAVQHSRCVAGTCYCLLGYKSVNQSTACSMRQISDSCYFDEDCSFAVAFSHCNVSSRQCACDSGRHTIDENQSECVLREIGDPCDLDDDCADAVEHSFCDVISFSCQCQSGYYVTGNGTSCTRRRILDDCRVDTDCSDAVTHSFCFKEAFPTQIEHPLNSQNLTEFNSTDFNQTTTESFQSANHSSIENTTTDLSPLNSTQNSSFLQVNSTGLISELRENQTAGNHMGDSGPLRKRRSTNSDGAPEAAQQMLDTANTTGTKHSEYHSPDNNTFSTTRWSEVTQERTDFFNVTSNDTVFNVFSDVENATRNDTTDTPEDRTSDTVGFCVCRSGFRVGVNGSSCLLRVIGDRCSVQEDCTDAVDNSSCSSSPHSPNISRTCQCDTGLRPVENGSQCVPRLISEPCAVGADCSTVEHSICEHRTRVCECMEAFYSSVDRSECILRQMGDSCDRDTHCSSAVENSECSATGCHSVPPCSSGGAGPGRGCSREPCSGVCVCTLGFMSQQRGAVCEKSKSDSIFSLLCRKLQLVPADAIVALFWKNILLE